VVPLLGIETQNNTIQLRLGGVDMLDGTPVLDVKPYLPYADSIPEATAGYAPASPKPGLVVLFSPQAAEQCDILDPVRYPDLKALISGLLGQDPRPAYKDAEGPKGYGMRLWDLNVRFSVVNAEIIVESIDIASGLTP
jgi:hypothetical protein